MFGQLKLYLDPLSPHQLKKKTKKKEKKKQKKNSNLDLLLQKFLDPRMCCWGPGRGEGQVSHIPLFIVKSIISLK